MSTAIQDMKIGKRITEFFVCAGKMVKVDRNDNKFLDLRLSNASGKVIAKMWDVSDSVANGFDKHDIVKVQAVINAAYKGDGVELKLENIRRANADDEINLDELLPVSPRPLAEMEEEFAGIRESITDVHLSGLLDEIFTTDTDYDAFLEAPAAKGMHHNYLHGLLEHTIAVCRVTDSLAQIYPEINRDLLLTGAILHDIGKIVEFDYTTAIDYSDQGRLLGHIVLGERIIAKAIRNINSREDDSFPKELELQLLHLILAHHGELEYGSPQLPQTIEAFFLHHADNIDAKANVFAKKRAETKEKWSEYDRVLGRFLYLRSDGEE